MRIARSALLGCFFVTFGSAALAAQTMSVKIIGRQEADQEYTYVIPGYSSSTTTSNGGCQGNLTANSNTTGFGSTSTTYTSGSTSTNCLGTAQTSGFNRPATQNSITVRGATLALQVPDGRVVIVNCESKFRERFAGPSGNKRSCRIPQVDEITVDFNGKKAKLKWPVSLDGKKLESETYEIVAIKQGS